MLLVLCGWFALAASAQVEPSTNALPVPTPSELSTNALPVPTPSQPSTNALPVPTPSEPSTNALPVPTPSQPSTNALPVPAPSELSTNALPVPTPSQPSTNALPVPAPSQPSTNALPVPVPSQPSTNALPVPAPSQPSTNALPVPAPSQPSTNALPDSAQSEPLTNALKSAVTNVLTNALMVQSNPGPSLTSTNLPGMATLGGYVPDDKHKLRPGDRISFQILEDHDSPKPMVVTDSGEVDIPYLGRMMVQDKTCKQLADELRILLTNSYYYRATVIIGLDSATKVMGKVYFVGQVRAQGPLNMQVNEPLTLGKAILQQGGFGDFANKKKVKVVRPSKVPGGTNQVFIINVKEILDDGKIEKDMLLEPDDFIIVPTRLFSF